MISEGAGLEGKQMPGDILQPGDILCTRKHKHCVCRWLRGGSGVTKTCSSVPAALPGKPWREVSESCQRERGMKLIWMLQFRVRDRKILQLLMWQDPW